MARTAEGLDNRAYGGTLEGATHLKVIPMHDPLQAAVRAAHDQLLSRLDAAASAVASNAGRQDIVRAVDSALVQAIRHDAAVCDVLLPLARRHFPRDDRRVHDYVQQLRRVERAVALTKGRIYGSSYARSASWPRVWTGLTTELEALTRLEDTIVADLTTALDPPARDEAAHRLQSVAETSPTRPHPLSAHVGRWGHLTRSWWARADRVWDAAEGRIVRDRVKDAPDDEDHLTA